MPENTPATIPDQPEAPTPLKKRMPVIAIMVAVIVLIGISNAAHLFSGGGPKAAPNSKLTTRPAAASPQQVNTYEKLQATEADRDADERARKQQLDAQMQQLQAEESVPGPEAETAQPMTPAQRAAIYGNSPNAPKRVSNTTQAQAEAKQRELARVKQHQDAVNSDTLAIDFAHTSTTAASAATGASTTSAEAQTEVMAESEQPTPQVTGEETSGPSPTLGPGAGSRSRSGALESVSDQQRKLSTTTDKDPMAPYPFDNYDGRLYRVLEGSVFEGVVTNHIDGGFNGPMIVMLTTDYYSHDHQQLLLPQGTRLIGTVQSVGSAQQRKLFVTFNRAICPDGFSIVLNRYVGLDPLGTTGLATSVNNHYLSSFVAAAAIGGLGGLAQIGNSASILTPDAEIRNGISEQTAQESEQILNRFLNRLPVITVKEGSRARIYITQDILIPSYAEHRVDPTL